MAEKISIRELARRINVSEGAIRKARGADKLKDCFNEKTKEVDWDKAQKNDWVLSAGVIKAKPGVSNAKVIDKLESKENENVISDEKKNIPSEKSSTQLPENIDELSEDELADALKLTSDMKQNEAVRIKEIINAAIDKIKLKLLQHVLVPKADVETAYYNYAAQFKKALLQIPDTHIDEIITAANKVEAMNILKTALVNVLEEYANAPEIQINTKII